MKPTLVLMAAGASRRLGECKALVDLAGSPPLTRLLEAGRCLDDDPPLVVGGAVADELERALPRGARYLHNRDWGRGRTGSVVLAARARPERDLCLAPVDVPLVPCEVFEALLEAWEQAGSPARGWLAPRFDGRHGHPVVVGRELLKELGEALEAHPELSLRDLRARAAPLLDVVVEAVEVLDDLDTPQDLARLRSRLDPK